MAATGAAVGDIVLYQYVDPDGVQRGVPAIVTVIESSFPATDTRDPKPDDDPANQVHLTVFVPSDTTGNVTQNVITVYNAVLDSGGTDPGTWDVIA